VTGVARTIVALSSGAGRAGLAVVRVSGRQARFAIETIAGPVPASRQAVLRRLRGADGEIIDSALVLFFPGPASFTGEDVAEFHVHGSRAVLARLLAELTGLPDICLAEAGEFTRRAFEAGKLDLAAVEGLADLIDSETEWQRRQALRQMEGALGRLVAGWRNELIDAMALLEADLDFSDEADVSTSVVTEALAKAGAVADELDGALRGFRTGERVREGFVVVIVGPPNAGKSSLLNALARRDVAIVAPVPGTTRDAIEVRLDLGGCPVVLVDTAGLRESDDPIEAEGVRRALALAERADLLLRLRAVDSEPDRFRAAGKALKLATKADLPGTVDADEIAISCRTGQGLDGLLDAIAHELEGLSMPEPALLTRERQRLAVADALASLRRSDALDPGRSELIAEELRLAVRALERLIGRVDVEDVLDRLFAGFCIGK
jgi:tRNA modification GTPase